MKQAKPGGVRGQAGRRRFQDLRVSIQPPELPSPGEVVQYGSGMPPLTYGAIHIEMTCPAIEAHQHLPYHYRFMPRILVCV
jgi:hypothetical protein